MKGPRGPSPPFLSVKASLIMANFVHLYNTYVCWSAGIMQILQASGAIKEERTCDSSLFLPRALVLSHSDTLFKVS